MITRLILAWILFLVADSLEWLAWKFSRTGVKIYYHYGWKEEHYGMLSHSC